MMLGHTRKAKLFLGGVCSIGIGYAAANVLPNIFFMDKVKEVVQMYSDGAPVPIPEKVSRTITSVMEDMQLSPDTRTHITPFTVYGFDVFHAGSTYTKYGALLGIPSNFYYSSVEEVDTENITVQNKHVDWLSSVGQRFKESMVLSEEAQKFLIAREIILINSHLIFLKSLFPLFSVTFIYTSVTKLERKLSLTQKPSIFRGILLTLCSLFGLGVWAFLNDISTVSTEIEADKEVYALGEQYQKGGLEVYSKLLERNICLRELMGSKGKSTYATSGNEVYYLRQKHLPLTHRKEFIEQMVTQPKPEIKTETNKHVPAVSV